MRAIAILLVCLVGLAPMGVLAQEIGAVNRVQGETRAEGSNPRPLVPGAAVSFGDIVTTGVAARIELTLADGTNVTMGERGRLVLDEFVYDPARGPGRAALQFASGAFRIISGAIGKQPDRALVVRTPVATIGIRGTDFWGGPLDDPMNVLVLDGAVVVSTNVGAVELRQGEGTNIAGPNAQPEPATVWGQARVARAVATVTFQ